MSKQLHAELIAAGITIPAPVTTASGTLATFEDRQPQPTDSDAVADSYGSGADDATVQAVALAKLAQSSMLTGHRIAAQRYERALTAAINAQAATINAALDSKIEALDPLNSADNEQRAHLAALKARVTG
ncbi:hypothetical protein ASG73_06065 [Janibacter sp. Soil728]|uniref:hypothetical protein n=1 Tax=Janibacter sp. Soil728 TaxID=1736393 RepID=UPI0006F2D9C0|nr:hypothetical protein [Janibacter sp. Soil728]KRE38493.1 hypothetical protein ASG73_06065 [Janibacter sp. Soil728]